jgi:hypothetical protein
MKLHDLRGGGVWGGAGYPSAVGTRPPQDLDFLVLFAGFASKEHQKRMIHRGLAASIPPCAGDRVTCGS